MFASPSNIALTGLNLDSNVPNLDSNVPNLASNGKSMAYDKLFEARLALNTSEHKRIAADRSTSRFISVRKAEAEAAMTLDDRMRRWSVQDFWAYETANSDWYHENFHFSAWFKRVNAAEAAEDAYKLLVHHNETGADSDECKAAYYEYLEKDSRHRRCLLQYYRACQANEKAHIIAQEVAGSECRDRLG